GMATCHAASTARAVPRTIPWEAIRPIPLPIPGQFDKTRLIPIEQTEPVPFPRPSVPPFPWREQPPQRPAPRPEPEPKPPTGKTIDVVPRTDGPKEERKRGTCKTVAPDMVLCQRACASADHGDHSTHHRQPAT